MGYGALKVCVDCGRTARSRGRGLCGACYQRHRTAGTLGLFARVQHRSIDEWLAEIGPADADACWPWPGSRNEDGYGLAWDGHRMARAHRVVYEHLIGAIPVDLTLDHLCHDSEVCRLGRACPHRACVNPRHLAPATQVENARRSLAGRRVCDQGHEQTTENTYHRDGRTWCRLCRLAAGRRSDRVQRIASGGRVHKGPDLCINDHPMTAENTYTHPVTGYRECRTCRRDADRRRRNRQVGRSAETINSQGRGRG